MANYAIMRFEKLKSINTANGRLKHNRRELNIDSLEHPGGKRYALYMGDDMQHAKGKSFTEVFKERTAGQRIRKNAVVAVEVLLSFSQGAVPPEQLKDWARESLKWCADKFGGEKNLVDAQLHLDESNPHIHVVLIPQDGRGKLSCSTFIDGPASCRELQTSYADYMQEFGLQRGVSKQITKRKHQDHKSWMAKNADKEATLDAYRKVFGDETSLEVLNSKYAEAIKERRDVQERPARSVLQKERSTLDDSLDVR